MIHRMQSDSEEEYHNWRCNRLTFRHIYQVKGGGAWHWVGLRGIGSRPGAPLLESLASSGVLGRSEGQKEVDHEIWGLNLRSQQVIKILGYVLWFPETAKRTMVFFKSFYWAALSYFLQEQARSVARGSFRQTMDEQGRAGRLFVTGPKRKCAPCQDPELIIEVHFYTDIGSETLFDVWCSTASSCTENVDDHVVPHTFMLVRRP